MAENRNQMDDMNRNQTQTGSGTGSTSNRGSKGLGDESMGTSAGTENDNRRGRNISDADYNVEGGDSGRGGSTGTGNTERSRGERSDSQMGEGGM